jgi:hypothetical protein
VHLLAAEDLTLPYNAGVRDGRQEQGWPRDPQAEATQEAEGSSDKRPDDPGSNTEEGNLTA